MPVSQSRDKTALTRAVTRTSTPSAPSTPPTPRSPAAYQRLHQDFTWHVPRHFNMAQVCCARWAALPDAAKRTAIQTYATEAATTEHSYAVLQQQANRLSNSLRVHGVARGDRVAIVMPQCFETAVAYMAVLQMGAVAMPLSLLFGPDALQYRLQDSEAVLAICDATALPHLQTVRKACPALRVVMGVGGGNASANAGHADGFHIDFGDALSQQSASFTAVDTLADDPAVLIYTSGTTGNPKGALLAHRALIGNLPGFVASQNWFGFDIFPPQGAASPSGGSDPRSGAAWGQQFSAGPPQGELAPSGGSAAWGQPSNSVFWSPADWAWTGGLMDALLPTLYFGRPIVAFKGRFNPQTALALMGSCGVTHTFLFPTALKAMMKAFPGTPNKTVRQQFKLKLQAIMSAGEAVGDAVFSYCAQQLGVQPNEMFGQTEINYIVGNCNALWPSKPGSMGMGYPGHRVQVIDEAGNECPVGVPGDVALHRLDVHGRPDPIFFLGYWKNDAATSAKFTGDWCRTGDLAVRDAEGYLWYQGRSDDVFKVAGYRIGPGEIENCLVKHPAVVNAAVVPKPDRERGALVKAYVVIAPDVLASCGGDAQATAGLHARLTQALQDHVKGLLAPYEYPKEIEFVDALPMTTTGKVQRRVLRLQEEERARQLNTVARP